MTKTIHIAIPMAGYGSRMRPHTWSKAKPLIPLAGKTVLDHALDQFRTLPAGWQADYVFIVSPFQKEQVQKHMAEHYPSLPYHIVVQEVMNGQSPALYLAREFLKGPMLMAFSDTLIDTDLSILESDQHDGLAWVMPVPDPRRFGVAVVDGAGRVTRLVEKPTEMDNNLVVVGFYYFRQGEALMDAIAEQMAGGDTIKGEFFLTEAINVMIRHGANFAPIKIDTWLDAGVISATLETNAWLLNHGRDNSAEAAARLQEATIIPPVHIHPTAQVKGAVIGPCVSLGAGCVVESAVVRNAIIDSDTTIHDMIVADAIIGKHVRLSGAPTRLNVGDNSSVEIRES